LRVVVDASVVSRWIIPGQPYEREAESLKSDALEGGVELHAPSTLLYDLASVLYRGVAGGYVEEGDAVLALKALARLGVVVHELGVDEVARVLLISVQSGLSAYDAAYVYLARELDALLVTADEGLFEKAVGMVKAMRLRDYPSRR